MLSGYKTKAMPSFLQMFGNPILLVNKDTTKANSPMISVNGSALNQKIVSAMYHNNTGKDVYFIPNTPGTRVSDIKYMTCCFVDLDAGKLANGKYKTGASVTSFKLRALNKVMKSPLKPNVIVETRNGYQLYWVFSGAMSAKASWTIVQNKIFDFFKDVGADSKVLKPNQLLRVPGTYWRKKHTGLPSFLCKAWANNVKFTFDEVFKAYSGQSGLKPNNNPNSYRRSTVNHQYPYGGNTPVIPEAWVQQQKRAKQTNTEFDEKFMSDLNDYLEEVTKILSFGNHKFLAKQGKEFQEKLLNNIAETQGVW